MKSLIIAGLLATLSVSQIHATVEVLSGTLSTTKNLSASTCYELDGCYRVLSGGVLNIPAGTVIRATSQSSLIVYKNGKLNASGSTSSPVVFTSAQPVSSRAPGDWDGIYIAGDAVDNQGTVNASKSCPGTIPYGGSNNADNSGAMQFVRIEYAGLAPVGDPESGGLNLWAVGTGTTMDHIQVSYCLKNAYNILGGKVSLNNLISLNAYKSDLFISEGYTGNIQFMTSVRLDANAHDNTGTLSNGLAISNDLTGSANTPVTHPIISNFTYFGPKYCGASSISSDYKAAARLFANAQAEIYNSVFAGWPTGFTIIDNSTIVNANVNGTLLASYNTFYANTANYTNSPSNFDPTGTGCASTITDWMDGSLACSQIDNFVRTSLTGYSSSICGNYCTTAPTMTLAGTNNVGATDFSWDEANAFDHVSNRGSLTGTDWSSSWAGWCPQNAEYCSLAFKKMSDAAEILHFAPNPSSSLTAVTFTTDQTGTVRISILDKVIGKTLRSFNRRLNAPGAQTLSIDVSGLPLGIYFVQLQLSNGQVLNGQLSIK